LEYGETLSERGSTLNPYSPGHVHEERGKKQIAAATEKYV
jgi:hypothetical protein